MIVHGIDHAHGVVPVHERGHDHGHDHVHAHDHDHAHGWSPTSGDRYLGPATISSPGKMGAGSPFEFAWTGPNQQGDQILLVRIGAADNSYHPDLLIAADGVVPAKFIAPAEPGRYEFRYRRSDGSILTRSQLAVESVSANVNSPDRVEAGATFQISWTGPNHASDHLLIVPAATADTAYYPALAIAANRSRPTTVRAPADPGEYELRYFLGGVSFSQGKRSVLARRRFTVTATSAVLAAPDQIEAGADFRFSWSGPNHDADRIHLVPVGTPDELHYPSLTVRVSEVKGGAMRAPTAPGDYELRYGIGGARLDIERTNILARHVIHVTPASATIQATDRVEAGAEFQVSWSGPNRAGDWVHVLPVNAEDSRYYHGAGIPGDATTPATLRAPAWPGDYELRYMLGGPSLTGAVVLARSRLSVTPVSAGIKAPSQVKAGAEYKLSWTGPRHAADQIRLVPAGTPDDRYSLRWTQSAVDAGSAVLRAPDAPGTYELRYVLIGQSIIARRSITVVKP